MWINYLCVAWLAGGLTAIVWYIITNVVPTFRQYVGDTGTAVVEVLHFMPRLLIVYMLWPVLVVGFLAEKMTRQGR